MAIRVTTGSAWSEANRRRCELIRKDVGFGLSDAERVELASLETLTDQRIALMDELDSPQPDEREPWSGSKWMGDGHPCEGWTAV